MEVARKLNQEQGHTRSASFVGNLVCPNFLRSKFSTFLTRHERKKGKAELELLSSGHMHDS